MQMALTALDTQKPITSVIAIDFFRGYIPLEILIEINQKNQLI